MAEILIPNIDLPTEERIQLSIYPDGTVINHSTLKVEKSRSKAIELPPHGDLKDGWVLFSLFERELGSSVIGQRIKNLIVNSPTIVEASATTPSKNHICPYYQGVCGLDEDILCYRHNSYEMCYTYKEASDE